MVDAPVSTVFGFHERPDALQLLSPAFPPIRVISASGGIQRGARVELKVAGLRWVAIHTAYEKDRLFVDEQAEGPFARWVHRHRFESLGSRTKLTDSVEYVLPGGPLVNTSLAWTVKAGLWQMFAHRHKVTRKWCERAQKA